MLNILLVIYADDMVLLSETPKNFLQYLICYQIMHKMEFDCKYKMTKIVIFRNGGKVRDNEKWFYNDCQLDIIHEFNYLGILFFQWKI